MQYVLQESMSVDRWDGKINWIKVLHLLQSSDEDAIVVEIVDIQKIFWDFVGCVRFYQEI